MTQSTPADLLRQEADLIEAGMALQGQGLALLLAEMRALAALMPSAATAPKSDSDIEGTFDNMPV